MSLKLYPCYKGQEYESEFSPFYILNGEMTSDQLRHFLTELYEYNSVDSRDGKTPELSDLIPALCNRAEENDCLVIAGGIYGVKGDTRVWPLCCCGTESWREWEDLKPGGCAPWTGHGVGPGVGLLEDHIVFLGPNDIQSTRIEFDELQVELVNVQSDLAAFLSLLEAWLHTKNIPDTGHFIKLLDENFYISKAD